VYVPSARPAEGVTDQLPPLRAADSVRTGVPDALEPLNTFTVTVAASPAPSPAAPENTGRESATVLPAAG
jgi:hypothetical protein